MSPSYRLPVVSAPIPVGAQENEDSVAITAPADCEATMEASGPPSLPGGRRVVAPGGSQPGVEFANESVINYDRAAAKGLTACLKDRSETLRMPHDCSPLIWKRDAFTS